MLYRIELRFKIVTNNSGEDHMRGASSAVGRYIPRPTDYSGGDRFIWPNQQTAAAAVSIGINSFFEIAKISMPITWVGNFPVRIWSVFTAFKQKKYVHIARNIISFVALFFRHGRAVAISVDMLFECISAYRHHCYKPSSPELKNKLDPIVRDQALRILDLSAEEAQDINRVTTKTSQMVNDLTQRKVKASPVIAKELQLLINDINAACKTLT